MAYDQQVGNPVPLKSSSVFVTVSRGIKRIKTTASGGLPIARKSKPRFIDYDILPGQGEEPLGEVDVQCGEGNARCDKEKEGSLYELAVEGDGGDEHPNTVKQGGVSERDRQDREEEAVVFTVQAGASTSCDQRSGKRRNDMKGLHDLLNRSMDSYKKNIKDTELGTLRILEKDVMDKALSKTIFRRGKTMASRGNFYYRLITFA